METFRHCTDSIQTLVTYFSNQWDYFYFLPCKLTLFNISQPNCSEIKLHKELHSADILHVIELATVSHFKSFV